MGIPPQDLIKHTQQLAFYLEQITKIILNCKNNPRIDFYEQMIALKAIQKTLPEAMKNLIWLHNNAGNPHRVPLTEVNKYDPNPDNAG